MEVQTCFTSKTLRSVMAGNWLNFIPNRVEVTSDQIKKRAGILN